MSMRVLLGYYYTLEIHVAIIDSLRARAERLCGEYHAMRYDGIWGMVMASRRCWADLESLVEKEVVRPFGFLSLSG